MPPKGIADKVSGRDAVVRDLFFRAIRAHPEHEWHHAPQAVDEKEHTRIDLTHYFERVFADQRILLSKSRKPLHFDTNATLASMLVAVQQFGAHLTPIALEARINKLEAAFREIQLHTGSGRDPGVSLAVALGRAKELLPVVTSTFQEAYGVEPKTVLVYPAHDEDHAVRVEIDASSGDAHILQKVRVEGARKHFYELLLDRMAREDFDLLSFDFRFPSS